MGAAVTAFRSNLATDLAWIDRAGLSKRRVARVAARMRRRLRRLETYRSGLADWALRKARTDQEDVVVGFFRRSLPPLLFPIRLPIGPLSDDWSSVGSAQQ